MPSQKNIDELTKLKGKVDRSVAIYFVDYQGLTHQQLEEARRELRANDSEIEVTKNTLTSIALKDQKDIDAKERLQGPTATLFADAVKTAKILSDFNKKYELPKIKWGILQGKTIEGDAVMALAKLPSKEVLLGKLVGTLQSPISGLVYALNFNTQKLAFVLRAIEEKKQQAS